MEKLLLGQIQDMNVKIKKLSENAKTPTSSPGNAGYDLYAAESAVIFPGQRALIKTDVAMEIPFGYYGRVSDRSGMAYKNGATCIGKIIDSVYRGNVGVILLNTDKHDNIIVKVGDRPAQIIFEQYHEAEFQEVDDLGVTERGDKGYGSSGGLTIVSQTATKEKTFLEIFEILKSDDKPDDWDEYTQNLVTEYYNTGQIESVSELFDYLALGIKNWSPQELKVISEKLGLPIGDEAVQITNSVYSDFISGQ